MTPDEHPPAVDLLTEAVDELRQDLDALHRDDVDQLLRPMLERAADLAAGPAVDAAAAAQLLDDLQYARVLLTGGVIV